MPDRHEIVERRSALSDSKRALLRERLQGRGRVGADAPSLGIPRRPADGAPVLSFAQQRLWFLDQLVPGSPFYTESSALRIQAPVSVPAFHRALNEIVRRHEVLRTTFPLIGEEPTALVIPTLEIPLPVVDLAASPPAQKEAEVLRLATAAAQRPFDLATGPLLCTSLLRLGPADWVFLLSMHHIVCDGWSSGVFSKELSEIYSAFLAGRPSPLEELPIQYGDFAHWQRSWLRGGVLETQLRYWREQLAELPQLELPTDHSRPPAFTYLGAHHKFRLPHATSVALEQLGQSEGATLFMSLLAGFKTLLHRYTNQDDIVVGVPVANRTRRELEKLIGFFVNVLVMRNDFSGVPTHREVLRRVRATALDAYAHQDLPFEKLVEDLHPHRDLARNPLFQVIFQLHGNPISGPRGASAALPLIEVDRATVKFDLRVDFFQDADGLQCVIEYSTDLFTPERIERMGRHLHTVYDSMVRQPDRSIGDFGLVTGAEKAILAGWGGAHQWTPIQSTIHARLEAQAALTPGAIAVAARHGSITYSDLNAAGDLVAAELEERGLRPGEVVAVPAQSSIEAVVAIIGILKTGCAYLPLNSSYPEERLRYILQETHARFLVAWGQAGDRYVPFRLKTVSVTLNTPNRRLRAPSCATPDSLAYVMYTSGSTGTPKGVCVTHRGVLRLVTDANFGSMSASETYILLAPLTFDASTLELWAPLLNGGKLVIYPEDRLSPTDLERAIATGGVTTLWLTAGVFHEIVDSKPEALGGLRQLLSGGDVLSPRHIRAHLDRYPHCVVINGYGPTENTTFTACHAMNASNEVPATVPIGRPITRTYVHVVDRYGQLAPIGVPGELWAGGDGLARGYLNDPALTAERFVPDPFCDRSQGPRRLYRTGDLGRFLPDGSLEFLGRTDRQLKIRGFRVEPGEIEKALAESPAVQHAVVLACDGRAGDKRLTAFVVPKAPETARPVDGWQDIVETFTAQWRSLYEDLYAARKHGTDTSFDISGWRASDTGDPIPAGEMQEWVECTVDRIRQYQPQRILEIGCGTGLLAWRLAPHAQLYVATDFSPAVVERLGRDLQQAGFDEARVRLLVQQANRLDGIDRRSFDAVVINSVVQYFPNVEYLMSTLEGAVEAAAPGGVIFVGDVRSLAHLAVFHAGVQFAKAETDTDASEMRRRIDKAIQMEQELVIDAAFFEHLPEHLPRITHVDVQWKRGRAENELTRYRYDVLLYVDAPHRPASDTLEMDWEDDRLTLDTLREKLIDTGADLVTVRGVPNYRIVEPTCLWRTLQEADGRQRVGDIRSGSDYRVNRPELEQFWAIAEHTPFVAHVRPGESDAAETCVVRYLRRHGNGSRPLTWQPVEATSRHLREYANDPLKLLMAEQLTPLLRAHLKERLPEYMLPSGFVVLEALPLTRNGKVDRRALAQLATESPVATSAFVAARDKIESCLAEIWCRVLRVERAGIHDNFFELGGDSILCIQVISKAKAEGIHITVKQMFENQTIAELAAVASEATSLQREQGPIVGPTTLTPAQAWLLEQDLPHVDHFNQSIFLEVPRGLDPSILDRALRSVVRHHDAFRLRFERSQGSWRPSYSPIEHRAILEADDLSRIERSRRTRELERHCSAVQAGLDIASGPVLRAVLYDLGPTQGARLLLAAHHLVVDGVSWRILLEDLWSAYAGLASGREPALPAASTSLHYWARHLAELANSSRLRDEVEFWLNIVPTEPKRLPVDGDGPNTVASVQVVVQELTEEETQAILTDVPQAFRTQVNDVLLTGLSRTLSAWTGTDEAYFDLEGHGREPLFDDVDLSRTVGWCTSIFPVRLQVDTTVSVASSLRSVQAQLAAIPHRGVGFGILRYLSDDGPVRDRLGALPRRQLSFNYLGQFGGNDPAATIRGASESQGPLRDPDAVREHLIELDGSVAYNRLRFNWSYSAGRHERTTIEWLARRMMDELRSLADACRRGEHRELTPEDFPAAGLEQEELQRLLTSLGISNGTD